MDDEYTPSSSSMPMILAALGVGTVVGAIIGFMATPSVEEITEEDDGLLPAEACESAFIRQDDDGYRNDWYTALSPGQRKDLYRALSEEEKKQLFLSLDPEFQADVCSMLDDEAEKQVLGIVEANRRLEEANNELYAAQQELAELKKKREAGSSRYKALQARVEELEAELVEVKAERDELKSALDQTVAALDKQIERTRKYKNLAVKYRNESVENQWSHFVAEAKLDICNDKAFKGRRESCHEDVRAGLPSSMEDRYSQCVKSGQAAPILREFSKKEARPMYTESLGDTGYLKKWGVIFCDPTLPEAGDPDLEDDL
jgi:hypothetical protein